MFKHALSMGFRFFWELMHFAKENGKSKIF